MTNSLKAAVCATLIAGSVCTGFANENPISYLDQAKELAGKAVVGLKQAGNVALEKGADVSSWAKDKTTSIYSTASDKVSGMYGAASGKGSNAYQAVSAKLALAFGYASDKAGFAYNWAENKTPEPVKAFIANHPYFTTAAVIAPVALFIGYKIGKAKNAEAKPADQDKK